MRLVVGSALVFRAVTGLWSEPSMTVATSSGFSVVCGLLVISGLWMPVVGTFVALIQIWQSMMLAEDPWVALLLGTMGGALAMLGPGLWSFDAHLFGWKRIEASLSRGRSESV